MRVYKFIDTKWGTEALRKGRLKISLLNELNDPYEGVCAQFRDPKKRRAWVKSHKEFAKTKGIVCFSSKWTNPVLWSHYADHHRGICIGFDIDMSIPLLKVAYSPKLVDGSQILNWSQDQKRIFAKQVYSTKFLDWRYESEVRAFCDLDVPDADTNLYFVDFAPDLLVKEVIFGARFDGNASLVREILSDEMTVSYKTARLAFSRFCVIEQENLQLQK